MERSAVGQESGHGMRAKVLILDSTVHADATRMLAPAYEVVSLPPRASEAEILEVVNGAVAFLVRSCTVTRRVIEGTPALRIIARHGVGVDSVDVPAATERGVVVTYTATANSSAVSEFTFALLLGLCRMLPAIDASMRAGAWMREAFIGAELEGRTLGIVGLGNIGTRVARHARGFGMGVLASDPEISEQDAAARGAILVSFDTLLRESDVISLHPRLTVTTRHLIDEKAIEKMKPGVRIVNTSRGQVINETALIGGLRSGRIAGAALDTFEEEPLDPGSPLRTMPNVILCPHIAGQTVESLRQMAAEAAQAILDELSGRTPAHVFNPEAYLQRSKGRRPV